jgi:hypothetical protein
MVIDFFDDLGESYFASLGGSRPSELLKTASWREPFEMLDRDFALIIIDENGQEHRKFACHDAGNVEMSLWYLENANHNLPSHAVKVAAANLLDAAGVTDVEIYPFTDDESRYVVDERRVHVPNFIKSATAPTQKVASADYSTAYDFLADVKQSWVDLDPFEKRANALALVEMSKTAAVSIPWEIQKYAGHGLNPRFETLMESRKNYAVNDQAADNYDRLGKMASHLHPEDVLETLYLIDESCSLTPRYGRSIPDPVLCVYGQEKAAEYSWISGSDRVTERQLIDFAASGGVEPQLDQIFDDAVVRAFRVKPIETFKAMPPEQKVILARLASQDGIHSDGGFSR